MKRLLKMQALSDYKQDEFPKCQICQYPVPNILLKEVNVSIINFPSLLCPICFQNMDGWGTAQQKIMVQANFNTNALIDASGFYDGLDCGENKI